MNKAAFAIGAGILLGLHCQAEIVYTNDFQASLGSEWSSRTLSTIPAGARRFLGQFGNQTVGLTLTNLPNHNNVTLSFDLLVISSWDGTRTGIGPDVWDLTVTAVGRLLHTTFNNHDYIPTDRQSYPDNYPGLQHPVHTGALEFNTLGYTDESSPSDAIYRLTFNFAHSASSLRCNFSASGLEGLSNESWGLDNIVVSVANLASNSPPMIVSTPQDQTVLVGQDAFFQVVGASVTPMRYQWKRDGLSLAGATNAFLVLTAVSLSQTGNYSVNLSTEYGTVTTAEARLTVVPVVDIAWERLYDGTVDGANRSGLYLGGKNWTKPTFVDIDGDGDQDFFMGSDEGTIVHFRNDGTRAAPSWTFDSDQYAGINVGNNSSPSFADIDADGDFDLFVSGGDGRIRFYRNNGTRFVPAWNLETANFESIVVGGTTFTALADIDNDGDLDLFVGDYRQVRFYRNDGTAQSPAWRLVSNNYVTGTFDQTTRPVFVDIDNDGDLDLFVGGPSSGIHYYRNDGTKTEARWTRVTDRYANIQGSSDITPAFCDIDGDGDFDLFTGEHWGVISFFRNDGTPAIPTWTRVPDTYFPIDLSGNVAPALADLDADGDLDLLLGQVHGSIYYFRNGGTRQNPNWKALGPQVTLPSGNHRHAYPALVDIDGDGDLDLIVGNGTWDTSERGGNLYFYRNTGKTNAPAWILASTNFASIDVGGYSVPAFVDIDGDGDQDLFMGDENGTLTFSRNDGTRTVPVWTLVSTNYAGIQVGGYSAPAFCDIDKDGDSDLFVGKADGTISFYQNVGDARSPAWILATPKFGDIDVGSYSVPTFADIDGDGRADLLIGEDSGGLNLYRNLGDLPPRVLTTQPIAGSQLRTVSSITASLNDPLDAASVNSANVTVVGSVTGPIEAVVSYDRTSRSVLITPNQPIANPETVTVTLISNLKDITGQTLDGNGNRVAEGAPADDFSWSFIVQGPLTFFITSTNDSGPGTLREVLQSAQQGDKIVFDSVVFPPQSPATIFLTSGLPPLTQGELTIDGSNAGVILDGSRAAPDTVALRVTSEGNAIRGLQIIRFPSTGVELSTGAKNNVIGGDRSVGSGPSGEGNVITLNNGDGISISGVGTTNNTVLGNLIGLDLDGTVERHPQALAISPAFANDGTVFVMTEEHGVFKSTTRGETWVQANTGLTNLNVKALILSPSYVTDHILFAGTRGGGVFNSTDGGMNWTPANTGLTNGWIEDLAISPNFSDDGVLLAATGWGGIFKSTNGGLTWRAANGGLTGRGIWRLAISPAYATDNTLFAGTDNGLFKSANGGSLWRIAGNTNGWIDALAVSPFFASDQTVLVGIGPTSVFSSADGGANWKETQIAPGLDSVAALAFSPDYANDSTVFAGTGWHFMKSVNKGTNWIQADNGLFGYNLRGIAVSPAYAFDRTVFVSPGWGGLFKSIDTGEKWRSANSGFTELGNRKNGVSIFNGAQANTVGGNTPGRRNVISHNGNAGIELAESSNRVAGNFIGTDLTGTKPLGNNHAGIWISGRNNQIGGTTPAERNVNSANNIHSVRIDGTGATGNTVSGNFIGTDASGSTALGNQGDGVLVVSGATQNTIGGCAAGAGNVISGNGINGVCLLGSGTMSNVIKGNFIGLDREGNAILGNGSDGIYLRDGASGNTIGGATLEAANVIAGNKNDGVSIGDVATRSNAISHNRIYANAGLGINLEGGANNGILPPRVLQVTTNFVAGTAGAGSVVEVFSDSDGQGRYFEGRAVADAAGTFVFNKSEDFQGPRVTATATDTSGNTSEFGLGIPPTIVAQPVSTIVVVGLDASFGVQATGTEPLSFQWFHNGSLLPRQGQTSFRLNLVQPSDTGSYVVLVSNYYGSVTSAPAILTVTGNPPLLAPLPASQMLKAGAPLTLSAPAQGWEPITYQWFFDSARIPGANQFELSIPSLQLTNTGGYWLQASNYFGVSTSAVAVVRVFNPLKIITAKATNQIQIGQSLTLKATVEGDGPFQYLWQINGEAIAGATNETYTITNIQPKDGGAYRVLVANSAEVSAADIAEVVVNVPLAPAGDKFAQRIPLTGIKDVLRTTNDWAAFEPGEPRHAGKEGGHSIWFAWQAPAQGNATFSTAGSSIDTLLAVYTGSQLTQLTPVASDEDRGGYLTSRIQMAVEAGMQYAIAVDGFAGATGAVVLAWGFVPTPDVLPQITAQPRSQMAAAGSDVTLQVQATGSNLRYQWYRNGAPVIGGTNAVLVLTNVGPAQVGAYWAQVINDGGTRTNESQMAFVEVSAVIDGQATTLALGQDKLEDLTGGGATRAMGVKAAGVSKLGTEATAWEGRRAAEPNLKIAADSGLDAPIGTATRRFSQVLRWQVVRPSGLPPVSGYTVSRWGDTRYDTTQLFENQGAEVITSHSRWQALGVPYAGICTLSTVGSEFDTVLEVVRMDGANLVRVAFDDNSGPDGKSSWLQFEADPAEEYYVRIAGVGEGKGMYQLTEVFEVPQRYRQWEYRAGAGYVFTLQVPKGMVFRVDGSTDLWNWQGILSTNSATGTYEFHHSDNQRYDHRFYRAILFP